MKMVMAVIVPSKLEDVRQALSAIGIEGMTITEVRGFGRQRGQKEIYRGAEYEVHFVPKVKIELAVPEERTDETISVIRISANTDKIGAGKIFVVDLKDVMRIRTGETGAGAL